MYRIHVGKRLVTADAYAGTGLNATTVEVKTMEDARGPGGSENATNKHTNGLKTIKD
jgi:hypothetical protein